MVRPIVPRDHGPSGRERSSDLLTLRVDQKGVRIHILSMATGAAIQCGLFGEDFAVSEAEAQGWRERAEELARYARELGGLVPQRALPEVLGISRQRVHQLVETGQFELWKYEGVRFITGRSIDAWEQDADKAKGGWRVRRGSIWQRTAASVKIGLEVSDAISSK